jgi:cell division protein FtsW
VPILIATSMLPKDMARRLALFAAVVFTLMLIMVPILGGEAKNGAQRWFQLGPIRAQPAEFLKPMFVVAVAWILTLKHKDVRLPTPVLSGLYLALIAGFLMKQPDFGQTVIFVFVWAVLLMISGVHVKWLGALAGAAIAGVGLAYLFYPVAHERIGRFLNSDDPSNREIGGQVESALKTLTHGGFLGTGPGGGTMKMNLPEPHTDYIFSVIGEEFGLVACIAIALIYLTIVVRVLLKLLHEEDRFLMLASAGLVTEFGLQAMINMAVNVHIAPSKGMTLPFISYGGSSMIALSMGFGLLLAFTRKNPYLTRSPYVVSFKAR